MKKILVLLIFVCNLASAQSPDTSTIEKKIRWDIEQMRGRALMNIPSGSLSRVLKHLGDGVVTRVPYMTVSDLRSGKADTAQVVQVVRNNKSWPYKYIPGSSALDDSVTIIRAGDRRYSLVTDKYTPELFMAVGDGVADDTEAIKKLIRYCTTNRFGIDINKGVFRITSPLTITSAMLGSQRGIYIQGAGASYTDSRFLYTGSGYCLNIIGQGSEGGSPITRFILANLTIDGNNNSTSSGGLYIERCYIVEMSMVSSVNWAGATAHACEFRNNFNLTVTGGNFSNGFPLPQGGSVFVVGSKLPSAWNTSNVIVEKTLIQRGKGYGLEVQQEDNILDGLLLNNVSFGGNQGGSVFVHSTNVEGVKITQCHFESAGYVNETTLNEANHIDIQGVSGLVIEANHLKDAKTHIKLHQVNGFSILPNKIYESGNYTINSSVGVAVSGDASRYSRGEISMQDIYSNFIDVSFTRDQYSRISWYLDQVTEAQWSATYASNPGVYEGAIIRRKEVRAGSVDASFHQLWTSDGTSWYRVVTSERGLGWAAAMPTSGSYTQGDIVFNRNPTIVGSAGLRYTVLGWRRITTGSSHVLGTDWTEMREYFDLDLSSFATNSALTSGLATKENTLTPGISSQYYRGDKSWQTLDKSAVGLSNVDNTSDLNKPVSTIQQSALDLKANDNSVVHLLGPESISGTKTFSSSPVFTDTWTNYQSTFGSINQGGRISFKRGSDGAVGTSIGYTSATSGTDFNINNSTTSGTFSVSTTQGRSFQIYNDGNIAIQTGGTFSNNGSKLQVTGRGTFSSDIEFLTNSTGPILRSPNGTKYRITVNDAGTQIVFTLVP